LYEFKLGSQSVNSCQLWHARSQRGSPSKYWFEEKIIEYKGEIIKFAFPQNKEGYAKCYTFSTPIVNIII